MQDSRTIPCGCGRVLVAHPSKLLGFWVFRLSVGQDLGLDGTGDWGLGLGLSFIFLRLIILDHVGLTSVHC